MRKKWLLWALAALVLAAGAGWLAWSARLQPVLPARPAAEVLVDIKFCDEDVTAHMNPDAVVRLLEATPCRWRWWKGSHGSISLDEYPWIVDIIYDGKPYHVRLGEDGFWKEGAGRREYTLEDPAALEAALLALLEADGVPVEDGRLPSELRLESAAIFYQGHRYYGGLYDLPWPDDAAYLGEVAAVEPLPASELSCTAAAWLGRSVYGFALEGHACFAAQTADGRTRVLVDGATGLNAPAVSPPVAAPEDAVGATYFYADGHAEGVAPDDAARMHEAALPGLTALTAAAGPADLEAALETAKATGVLLELRYARPALYRRAELAAADTVATPSFRYDRAYLILQAGESPLPDGAVVLGAAVYTGFQPPAALTALLDREKQACYDEGIWE